MTVELKKAKIDCLSQFIDEHWQNILLADGPAAAAALVAESRMTAANAVNDYLRMLSEAKTAEWKVVLCFSRDRFARLDSFEAVFAKQTLRKAGKRLHPIDGTVADWETPEGRIADAMADESCNQLSVKVSRATSEGRWSEFINERHHAKRPPYGMAREVTDWDGNVRHICRTETFTRPDHWTQTYVLGDPIEQK